MLNWDAMRPASLRRFLPSMVPVGLAIAALLLVVASVFAVFHSSSALAESQPLLVAAEESLSLVGRPVTITVSGQLQQSLVGTKLTVSLLGPVVAAQVGQTKVDAASVKQITQWLGAVSTEAESVGATTTSLRPQGSSTTQDLTSGVLKTTVTIPAGSPKAPGAYLVSVELRSGAKVLAGGRTWLGKAAGRVTPLDVSFVLPVSLGIHRDWSGRFFDQALEKATLPVESGSDTVRSLIPLVDGLSRWRLTLAVEPILLTQLRDMADGYVYSDATGKQTKVDQNDLAAQNAASSISDLAGLAMRESVEMLVSPYTGADLGLLAAEGWRDGLEQIQMGKQELQSTLSLDAPLIGAYAPGLSITGDSLAYYADASVDHIVVSSDVGGSLAETVSPGTVAVRAENAGSDRVTLVFASSAVGAAMQAPWDVSVFSAALAADLATGARSALVIAPRDVFGLISLQYLQGVGRVLTSQSWIRTQKLQELMSVHSPDSRPILLVDTSPGPQGYIEDRLMDGVREAHVPVSDLAAGADTTKAAVDQVHQLIYVAESRWWSREGSSPEEASMGLAYARQAQVAASKELAKVRFLNADSPLITQGQGTVRIAIDNAADYQVTAELRLSGAGLGFPDGEALALELQPGRTNLQVKVTSEGGHRKLTASLIVGTTVVDEFTHTVRRVGLWTVLPWVLAAIGLLGIGGGYLLVRRNSRKRRAAEAE